MAIFGRQSMTPGNGIQETSLAAVPTSNTNIAGADSWLFQLHINNSTGGAVTFTLTDAQGTPVAALSAVSIGANTAYVMAWPFGLYLQGGFNIQAGGSGLKYSAVWRQ